MAEISLLNLSNADKHRADCLTFCGQFKTGIMVLFFYLYLVNNFLYQI